MGVIAKMVNPRGELLRLRIVNRKKELLNDEVAAVTSVNGMGEFDILPQHANFISIIKDYIVVHKRGGSMSSIKINQGVMDVRHNRVQIFLDIGSREEFGEVTEGDLRGK